MTRYLTASLLLFLVSAFALPTEAAYSLVFYVCVMPLAVLAASLRGFRPEVSTAPPLSKPGFGLALALVLWSGLTLAWGEDDGGRSVGFLLGVAATAAFLLALWQVLPSPAVRQLLATALIVAGAANAGFVLVLNAPALLHGDRILGWGVTKQPILGGSVMAAACLIGLSRLLGGRQNWRASTACGVATLVMAAFVLAMQSRGALLGLMGGVAVICCSTFRLGRLAGTAAVLTNAVFMLPTDFKQHVARLILQRGTSHRLEIWQRTLGFVRQKPLLGHGLAANLPVSPTGFPHSLYLSLLFYSGATGFLLFGALAIAVTVRLIRASSRQERTCISALWVSALLAGLTDFGQITKGPGELWLIVWMPIMLALALPEAPRAAAADLPPAAI